MNPEQLKKLSEKTGIFEPQLKELLGQYEDWINHVGTSAMITILRKRKDNYVKGLTEHILSKSDKEYEDKQRAAISTCESILRIVTEPELFVEHLTKK